MNRKFSCAALFAALILSWSLVATTSAVAVEFQEEVAAAATKGTTTLGELTAFRDFLDAAGSDALKNMAITNVKTSPGVLTGDVRLFNSQFSILVYGGGGAKSSFIAFEGKGKPFSFSRMFGDGAKLLDVLVPERQMLFFSVGDVKLRKKDIPSNVQKIVGGLFIDDDYELKLNQGINVLGVSDLGKSKVMADAIKFLGGKATLVAFHASVAGAGSVLGSLAKGGTPLVPYIGLTALLPKFRPHIGNLIRFPSDIQFELSAAVSTKKAELGIKTGFEFEHAKGAKPAEMVLETKVSLEKGEEPTFEVSAGMAEGKKLEGAFGVKWLTLSDYKMTFKDKPGGLIYIKIGGNTSFGEKTLHLVGGIQVGAATAGVPVPEKLEFAIDDGPNKVGQLSLVDIVKAFEFMAKESGKNSKLEYKNFPDIAITGTKIGEGPSIRIALRPSSSALSAKAETGFDITGRLRFLGSYIATVERAFLGSASGFQLTAKTGELDGVGPFKFPDVAIDAALAVGQEPRLILRTKKASLFGGSSALDLVVTPGQFLLASKTAYGSLFTFDFSAYTGERITDIDGLKNADFIIDARLTSDIGKWIKDTGREVVKESFGKFTSSPAVSKAVADLNREITTLNTKIANRKAQILRKRASINESKKKVGELNVTINELSRQIAHFDGLSRRSCNQTVSICIWYDIFKKECTAHKTVADVFKRSACVAENGAAWTKKVERETARATVVAARVVAEKTLTAVEKGVSLLPTDLDPEVAGYYVDRDAKMLLLSAANATLREFKKASAFLIEGTNFVGNVGSDNFKITSARVQGSLRAAMQDKPVQPVVLTLDYRLHGKDHRDRLAYSIKNAAYNKAQAEVWILGIAIQAMTEFAHSQPLVPYAFLEGAIKHYKAVQADAQAEVAKALANLHMEEKGAKPIPSINDVLLSEQKAFNEHRSAARGAALDKTKADLDKERKIRAGILVVDPGDLIYYRLKNGQFGGLPAKIGQGWDGFKTVFAGVGYRLYGIKPGGALHYYTQNAAGKFLSSKVIGSGWQKYKSVFSGPVGVIYAVTTDGHLYIYRHDAAGRFTILKEHAGSGWNACKTFFTNGKTLLYCVKNDNSLWIWGINPNGTISEQGSKHGSGFGFKHIFSGGGGIIYGIDNRGVLLKYDHAWPFRWITTGKKVGGGWSDYAKVASNGSWVYAVRK